MSNKETTKKSVTKKLLITIILVLLCIVGAGAYLYSGNKTGNKIDLNTIENMTEDTKDDVLEQINSLISEEDRNYISMYDEYYSSSEFIKGIIMFESGLIDEPVVQGPDNYLFLRTDWQTMGHSELGSVFMDYECDVETSQNLIIYGHNVRSTYDAGVDEDGNPLVNDELMFTPLKFLTKEENYEKNKTIYLVLENEVRTYEIAYVFYVQLEGEDSDNMYIKDEAAQYYLPNYSSDLFAAYKNFVERNAFYDTGIEINETDKLLTLQTCIEGNTMAREVVLCKQVDSHALDRDAYNTYIEKMDEYNAKVLELDSEQEQ